MSKYTHSIPNGIVDATPDQIAEYCEAVLQQSRGLVSGEIDLNEFVEDMLDAREIQAEKFGSHPHGHYGGSRSAHKAALLRDIPKAARAVARYRQAWWVEVDGDDHMLCGVSMSPDASSGHVVMPYRTIQDCSAKFPAAYSPVLPSPHPVVSL